MSSPPPEVSPALVRVAVVDDNTLYREWLGQGGTLSAHHHVVARAATAEALADVLDRLPDGRCDLVLLDLRIVPETVPDPMHGGPAPAPVVEGRDAVTLVLRAAEDAVRRGSLQAVPAVLVHTQEAAPRVHVACLLAGACGVVRKGAPLERLREAIDVAAGGGTVLDEPTAALLEVLADQQRMDLTDTESSVLALTAHGWTRRRIARQLDSSESTVDKHLRAVRAKFATSRAWSIWQMPSVCVISPRRSRPCRRPTGSGCARFWAGAAEAERCRFRPWRFLAMVGLRVPPP